MFKKCGLYILGYGHIAPSDESGQLTLVLYTILGLPMMMVFLANIGGVMAKALKYSYSRFCCRWCRVRRKFEENPDDMEISLKNDEVGQESYMPTDFVS